MEWSCVFLLLLNAWITLAQDTASAITQASDQSLLWGPYRPNLYLGIRPRLPDSFFTGLMWSRAEDYQSIAHTLRFTCEQHSGMEGYGWDVYDPRTGGVQKIKDKENGIDLEIFFAKFDGGKSGWGARVKGTVRDDASPGLGSQNGVKEQLKTTLLFSVGVEGAGDMSQAVETDGATDLGFEGDVNIVGGTESLGEFCLTITEPDSNSHPTHNHPSYHTKRLDRTLVHSMLMPLEALWQGKALAFNSFQTTIDGYLKLYTEDNMPPPWQTYTVPHQPGSGNLHLVQKSYEGDFEFDVFYSSSPRPSNHTSADLTKAIEYIVQEFNTKYSAVLPLQAPFKGSKYVRFSKSLFSNLIGGLGYFHGDHLVDRSYASEYEEEDEGFYLSADGARGRHRQQLEGPYTLFTSVPSRPFFPRGFLWDEGFHLLPVVDFDPEIVMQVMSSWFEGMMDEDGWIPREVILGHEARSKVPPEFQVQYPHYANPPTLFMLLETLLDKEESGAAAGAPSSANLETTVLKGWLQRLYPLLQRNYEWYRRTQFGELRAYDRGSIFSTKEGYRWRGRTPQHILTSGMDDYPRAQPPHPAELHTDLLSWMGMMTRALRRVAAFLNEVEDVERYEKNLEAIKRNIDDLHWDKSREIYCDVTVDDYEESVHICHKGYISIFPFMTGLMGADHEHLGAVLDLIANEDELWSPFGIRSLSKEDEFYATEENYWRSPVWMNINYLVLENLLRIAESSGLHSQKAAKMYTALRKNLVTTVYNSWEKTGFAWEQYNPETGEGQRTQHFTGWTSLVVKMMAMPDVPVSGTRKGGHDEL